MHAFLLLPADQHDVKSELSSATEEPEAKMAARVEFDECKLVLKADICSLCGVKFNKVRPGLLFQSRFLISGVQLCSQMLKDLIFHTYFLGTF